MLGRIDVTSVVGHIDVTSEHEFWTLVVSVWEQAFDTLIETTQQNTVAAKELSCSDPAICNPPELFAPVGEPIVVFSTRSKWEHAAS